MLIPSAGIRSVTGIERLVASAAGTAGAATLARSARRRRGGPRQGMVGTARSPVPPTRHRPEGAPPSRRTTRRVPVARPGRDRSRSPERRGAVVRRGLAPAPAGHGRRGARSQQGGRAQSDQCVVAGVAGSAPSRVPGAPRGMTAEVVAPAADPVPLLPSPDMTLPVVETDPVVPDEPDAVVPPVDPDGRGGGRRGSAAVVVRGRRRGRGRAPGLGDHVVVEGDRAVAGEAPGPAGWPPCPATPR